MPPGDFVIARAFPDGVPPGAPAGINLFARGVNVSWVLDGDAQRGYALIYDENANGDLRDDPAHAFSPIAGGFELAITQSTPQRPGTWPTRLRIRDGKMFEQAERVRRGTVELDGQRRAVELRATSAYWNPMATVAIDLDGDGVAGPVPRAGENPGERWLRERDAPEVVLMAQPAINLGARTYDVAVDPGGDQLTLTPRATRMPDRPSLQVGSIPPDFAIDDLDGQRLQLSALRGRPIVLDFWITACGPCIAAMPELAALAERHPELALVSLAGDESADDIRTTLASHPHAGRVAQYGEALARTYRVYAMPTYFVVGADGKIAVARGKLDDVLAYFDRGSHDLSTR